MSWWPLGAETSWYICMRMMQFARMCSKCSEHCATRCTGSLPHTLFFLSKVRLNNGVFGGRWLTLTHWFAQTVTEKWRVWVGCGKCVSGPEQYVKACVLKRLLQSSQQPPWADLSSPLLNTWHRCLSSFSRCVSVSHTSLYCCLCSGWPKNVCLCVLWKS